MVCGVTDHRLECSGENGEPTPRDLPDQQAREGEDPWDLAPSVAAEEDEPANDVPGTDEAGTGRQGVPRSHIVRPESLAPHESSA